MKPSGAARFAKPNYRWHSVPCLHFEIGKTHLSMSSKDLARAKFHEPHLLRVSRSFAHGIGRLEPRLKAHVGLGYLLCRILDTVEDAIWSTPVQQLDAFEAFDSFLTRAPAPEVVEAWVSGFPNSIPEGERLLLSDAPRVFAEFHGLAKTEQEVMQAPILSMSAGMKHFTKQTRETGSLRLRSQVETNGYCFFVAGVVGELLTGLLQLELKAGLSETAFVDGCHFGLFLQKMNVLKDQWSDEREGRFFVADRLELLASIRTHADLALRYILEIPTERSDYRLFCAWALFLGLATMPLLEAATPNEQGPTKLSRSRALLLGGKIELAINDNQKLRRLFDSLVSESASLSGTASDRESGMSSREPNEAEDVIETVFKLYSGKLSQDELVQVLIPEV